MDVLKIIGILVFVQCFAIQIYACAYHNHKLRIISKFFIMPSLAILALCFRCDKILIYLGILFGYLGDIFLIDKSKVKFTLGILFFGLNHLSFIGTMAFYIFENAIKWYFYLAAFLVYLAIAIPCIFIFRKHINKTFGLAGALYLPLILIELGFSIITSNITVGMCSLPILGSILFLISDCWLSYSHFIKHHDFDDLLVMSTYSIAQYCFVFGFVLFL